MAKHARRTARAQRIRSYRQKGARHRQAPAHEVTHAELAMHVPVPSGSDFGHPQNTGDMSGVTSLQKRVHVSVLHVLTFFEYYVPSIIQHALTGPKIAPLLPFSPEHLAIPYTFPRQWKRIKKQREKEKKQAAKAAAKAVRPFQPLLEL
eukprot:1075390-Amorphochlora_amoeboformis.AAC.1